MVGFLRFNKILTRRTMICAFLFYFDIEFNKPSFSIPYGDLNHDKKVNK